jgi:hypothetical protein
MAYNYTNSSFDLPMTLLFSLSHSAGAILLSRHRNIYCMKDKIDEEYILHEKRN